MFRNAILILTILTLTSMHASNELVYPKYNVCDPQWADEQLWISIVESSMQYTFCNDEESNRQPMFLNGRLMTFLANGLAARGIESKSMGVITPHVMNQVLLNTFIRPEEEEEFNVDVSIDFSDPVIEVNQLKEYLEGNWIVFGNSGEEGSIVWFLITNFDGTVIQGINENGKQVIINLDSTLFISGWGLNYHDQTKFLDFIQ